MNRRGQHIIFGSIFLLFIFFLVVTIFFDDLFFTPRMNEEQFDLLQREAVRAAENLVRQGYPTGWDETNVRRVGLTSGGIFDQGKLAALINLYDSGAGYDQLKPLLGVQHEYFIAIDTLVFSDGWATEQELLDTMPAHLATQTRTLITTTGSKVVITVHSYQEGMI